MFWEVSILRCIFISLRKVAIIRSVSGKSRCEDSNRFLVVTRPDFGMKGSGV